METKSKQKRDSKGRFVSAKTQVKNKYEPGTFGYWWTVIEGNKDIEGQVYKGDINCGCNKLTSLKGAPKEVGGYFYCNYNNLISLQGAPKEVGGDFYCSYNNLTSLQGAPEKVGGNFWCHNNKLTSLQGAPKEVGGVFSCNYSSLSSCQVSTQKETERTSARAACKGSCKCTGEGACKGGSKPKVLSVEEAERNLAAALSALADAYGLSDSDFKCDITVTTSEGKRTLSNG